MPRRAPGEGSITRRKNGLWQASLQIAGVRKIVYAKTEREARQKLQELRRQATVQGALPDPGKRTVNDLLSAWLEAKAPRWRPRTLADWRYVCDVHLRPTLGKVRLSKLTPERIHHHLAHLEAQGKGRTALKVYRALSAACALAVRWGWLAQNPCERADAPRYRPQRKEVWTPAELQRFLQETEGHRLGPLWAFLAASGCRLGEALGLTWQDVDWEGQAVHVRQTLQRVNGEWVLQEPKTEAGRRTVALPPWGLSALKRQRAQQAAWRLKAGAGWRNTWGLVFTTPQGSPLHGPVVAHALRRECARLGLPPLTPHGLRHWHASLLLAARVPLPEVAQRLGHATPAVTTNIYAHALKGADQAVQALQEAL